MKVLLIGLVAILSLNLMAKTQCLIVMNDAHNGFTATMEAFQKSDQSYQVILHETQSGGFDFSRQEVTVVEENGSVRFYLGKDAIMPSSKSYDIIEAITQDFFEYDPSEKISWDYGACHKSLKTQRALIHYLINGWFFYGK